MDDRQWRADSDAGVIYAHVSVTVSLCCFFSCFNFAKEDGYFGDVVFDRVWVSVIKI